MSNKKMPWELPSTPWKTKASFMSYIRGCLRKAWNQHPVKLNKIKEDRIQVPNPNPRGNKKTVWGFSCELCGDQKVIKEAQVDHITPAGSLQEISDIQGFAERLLIVTEDDLRLICKTCNSTLAYADKHGISFELASATKKAIAIQKEKLDKEFLEGHNVKPESNAKARREQIIEILMED